MLVEDDFFGRTSTHQTSNLIHGVRLVHQHLVFTWQHDCISAGASTWHNRYLVDNTSFIQNQTNDGVTSFVVSNRLTFLSRNNTVLLSWSRNNTVLSFIHVLGVNRIVVLTSSQQGRFVQQVFQVGSNETRCLLSNFLQIHVVSQWLVLSVDVQDCLTTLNVWTTNQNLSVETTWTKQSWVQDIRTVSSGHYNDTFAA